MTEPTTEAGRRHFELMSQRYARLTRADVAAIEAEARSAADRDAEPFVKAAIEAEAQRRVADLARRIEARVKGWLSDPLWPQFGPGIGVEPLDAGRMAARAAAEQVLDTVRDEAAK